jgi:hypothetical protein
MAELTVRQGELVVTMDPREKRSFTRFGLRRSRSKLLDGLELRVPLAEVAGVRVSDSYWELRDHMDGRNARGAGQRRGAYQDYQPPEQQPWVGIYNVKEEDGGWQKKLCVIHGQHSPVVVVDLGAASKAPFAKLVVTVLPWQSDPVAASIKAAAGLT